jgi:hypothetical protein
MGRSHDPAGQSFTLSHTSDSLQVYVEKFHRHYAIFTKRGELYQSDYEVGPAGRDVFRDTQRIAYLIGAETDGVTYVVRKGNYLFEAPLSYYTRLHSWALSPGYDRGDSGFHRQVLPECAVCHSGRPRPLQGVRGLYKKSALSRAAHRLRELSRSRPVACGRANKPCARNGPD